MTSNPEQSIKRLCERIDEAEDMSEADTKILRRMSDRIRILGPSKYSDFAHKKYLMRAVKMAQEVGGLAWDLGPRPFELFDLTPKQISDHKYGLQVTGNGKQGRRSPVLIPSVPYVNRWLEVHPGSGVIRCNVTSTPATRSRTIASETS
jgi:hypothetical protein